MSEAKAAQGVVIDALAADGGAASTLGAAFRRIRHLLEGRDLSGGIDRHELDILGSVLFAMMLAVVMLLGARNGQADKGEFHKPLDMQLSTVIEEPGR